MKRTVPLQRGESRLATRVPLRPTGSLTRRAPLEAVAAERKPRRDTGPGARTRAAVYTRDGYACVCCGISILGRPHSVGHRKRRSQGGGNEMPNLLTFLGLGSDPGNPYDHHARIDHRQDPADKDKGYRVDSTEDPAGVSVQYFEPSGSGFTAYLGGDGSLLAEDGTVLYRPDGGWAA